MFQWGRSEDKPQESTYYEHNVDETLFTVPRKNDQRSYLYMWQSNNTHEYKIRGAWLTENNLRCRRYGHRVKLYPFKSLFNFIENKIVF